jgi:hypothetical protein
MRALYWRIMLALRLVRRYRVPLRYRPLTEAQCGHLAVFAPFDVILSNSLQVKHDWLEMHAPPGLCG